MSWPICSLRKVSFHHLQDRKCPCQRLYEPIEILAEEGHVIANDETGDCKPVCYILSVATPWGAMPSLLYLPAEDDSQGASVDSLDT